MKDEFHTLKLYVIMQGLDAAAKRKLWNVIRAARDVGLTIIMTSHR